MKKLLNLLVVLSLLGLAYCVLGVLQTGMLAGAPNYPRVLAESREHFWTRMSGACLGLSTPFLCLRLIIKKESK